MFVIVQANGTWIAIWGPEFKAGLSREPTEGVVIATDGNCVGDNTFWNLVVKGNHSDT